jgi:hypothetical protein
MKASLAEFMKLRISVLIACLACCCGTAVADFAGSVNVKGKAEFVEAMMKAFRSLDPDGGSFASYGRRGAVPLSNLVSSGTEARKRVVYVEVFREVSKDHGARGNEARYVAEFPIKARVDKPEVTYELDAAKVANLAIWPTSVSMISQCVRETVTQKLTWSASHLRIAFENDREMEEFLKSLATLLFDGKDGDEKGYVTLTKNPF